MKVERISDSFPLSLDLASTVQNAKGNRNGGLLNCCGSCSTHATRKPEGPRKFSARTVTRKDSRPLLFQKRKHSELLLVVARIMCQENRKACVCFFCATGIKKTPDPFFYRTHAGNSRRRVASTSPKVSFMLLLENLTYCTPWTLENSSTPSSSRRIARGKPSVPERGPPHE